MRRQARTLLSAFVAAAILLPAGPFAGAAPGAGPGRHPHFEDQGTLRWYRSWAEASAVARSEGRVVFMDMGRRACPGCQTLVERILPDPRVRQRLARAAVGWSVDADQREAFVDQLRARHLPGETLLPMIGFVRPDGAWITGSAGSVRLDAFLQQLARAEAHARPTACAHLCAHRGARRSGRRREPAPARAASRRPGGWSERIPPRPPGRSGPAGGARAHPRTMRRAHAVPGRSHLVLRRAEPWLLLPAPRVLPPPTLRSPTLRTSSVHAARRGGKRA